MRERTWTIASAVVFLCLLGVRQTPVQAQGVPLPVEELPLAKDLSVPSGQTVTPVYEGWYQNPDGTYSIVFGYYSRNGEEVVHVPIGVDNVIRGADHVMEQPTDFEPGRHWGVFAARVPADFDGEVTWTLRNRGKTFDIPGGLDPLWETDAIRGDAMGNHPPKIRFSDDGATGMGPAGIDAEPLETVLGEPLEITVWGSDDGITESVMGASEGTPPVSLHWTKQSGPGSVFFTPADARIPADGGSAKTHAEFSMPGTYVLRLRANDASGVVGGGHSQCCWTNGYVEVTVHDGSRRSP
jgi:hypothetical protein